LGWDPSGLAWELGAKELPPLVRLGRQNVHKAVKFSPAKLCDFRLGGMRLPRYS